MQSLNKLGKFLCLFLSLYLSQILIAGNCLSACDNVNVQELYLKPKLSELFDMSDRLTELDRAYFKIKSEFDKKKQYEKLAVGTNLEERLLEVKRALRAVIQYRSHWDKAVAGQVCAEGEEGCPAGDDEVLGPNPDKFAHHPGRGLAQPEEAALYYELQFERSFLGLKEACSALYEETNLLYKLNKKLGISHRMKRKKVKKLKLGIISMARSGHILILP